MIVIFCVKNMLIIDRGSRPEVFCEKGVLINFAKFTEKPLCRSLVFNKVADLRDSRERVWHRRFHVHFAKFLRIPVFKEHFW